MEDNAGVSLLFTFEHEEAFGSEIDYAMIIKLYGVTEDETTRRYSPAKCIGCEKEVIQGAPDMTSFQRLTLNARISP